MVMLTRSDLKCPECANALEVYQNFTQHTKQKVYSFLVDCKELWEQTIQRDHLPACDPEEKDQLPLISFFVPPREEFDPYKKQRLRPKNVPVSRPSLTHYIRSDPLNSCSKECC